MSPIGHYAALRPLHLTMVGASVAWLLVVHVGLGTMALRRARGAAARRGWTLAAPGCYGSLVLVGRAHAAAANAASACYLSSRGGRSGARPNQRP